MFFDVDFTLIRPGPRFQGSGYRESCARHGIDVDAGRFDEAVAGALAMLDTSDPRYSVELFVAFTRRIIEGMGGHGESLDLVAREIYDDWAEHRHFELYDDVPDTLAALHKQGIRLGLISNAHRCLDSFQTHFRLEGLIDVTVSSAEHGYLKPDRRIFQAALDAMGIRAPDAAMVGDSLTHDVAGARRVGMRGILVARDSTARTAADCEVIRSLAELPALL